MLSRKNAIKRALVIQAEQDAAVAKYTHEIEQMTLRIDRMQQEREQLVAVASDHVTRLIGRYEEVMELFEITSAELEEEKRERDLLMEQSGYGDPLANLALTKEGSNAENSAKNEGCCQSGCTGECAKAISLGEVEETRGQPAFASA